MIAKVRLGRWVVARIGVNWHDELRLGKVGFGRWGVLRYVEGWLCEAGCGSCGTMWRVTVWIGELSYGKAVEECRGVALYVEASFGELWCVAVRFVKADEVGVLRLAMVMRGSVRHGMVSF